MPAEADSFIPAKGVILDAPVSGDSRFYQRRSEQLSFLWAMVNERRSAAGLSQPTAPSLPLENIASTINSLRSNVEAAIPYYINTDVHAGGSIVGASTITMWTKANLFSEFGIGDGANWTNIPSDGEWPGSTPSFASTLPIKSLCYVAHVNEILLVCQQLIYRTNYLSVSLIPTGHLTDKLVRAGSADFQPDCTTAKTNADAAWGDVAGLESPGPFGMFEYTITDIGYGPYRIAAGLGAVVGSVSWDISSLSLTSARVFMKITLGGTGTGGLWQGRTLTQLSNAPVSNLDVWELYASPTLGASWSDTIANTKPAFSAGQSCPLVWNQPSDDRGWQLTGMQAVWEPSFSYA